MYRPRFKGTEENPIRATNTRTWYIDEAAVKPVRSCGSRITGKQRGHPSSD